MTRKKATKRRPRKLPASSDGNLFTAIEMDLATREARNDAQRNLILTIACCMCDAFDDAEVAGWVEVMRHAVTERESMALARTKKIGPFAQASSRAGYTRWRRALAVIGAIEDLRRVNRWSTNQEVAR